MTISINQPAYLPWLGYFDRIDAADIHVILDHVQFEKNSFTNRNKIKTPNGAAMLTVPVKTKGLFGELPIRQLEIDSNNKWKRKHLSSIRQSYSKSKYFRDYFGLIEQSLLNEEQSFLNLTNTLNTQILNCLGIQTNCISSSDLNLKSSKSDLVLDICQELGANKYISGPFGRDYLDINKFSENNIEIVFHDYLPQNYTQLYGDFEPFMAVIDLLFNEGNRALEIIRNGRKMNHD